MIRVPKGATHNKKRLGRGTSSGVGKTSGKGHKGQNARSGGGVRPGFEGGQMPLYRRVARRGFSNYPFKIERVPVSLARLEELFEDGDVVSLESLVERNVVRKSEVHVKILGDGELTKKVTVKGLKVSASARAKIESAGGTVEEEQD
jgi:large subunit ribosomal protein L15